MLEPNCEIDKRLTCQCLGVLSVRVRGRGGRGVSGHDLDLIVALTLVRLNGHRRSVLVRHGHFAALPSKLASATLKMRKQIVSS
jgi:hypothetical protein